MEAKTLALYLGCQFRYRYVDWEKDSWSPFTILNGRDIDKMQDLSIDKIQLLLRPLSSMTEEEKLKLYQFGFTCNRKGLQIEEPQKWHCFKPEQFQWLLSEGFDLFGLIEKGQAIDSTKL